MPIGRLVSYGSDSSSSMVLLVGALITGGSDAEPLMSSDTGCYAPRCLCFLSLVPWVAFLDVLILGALCLQRLVRFYEGCWLPWGPGQCPELSCEQLPKLRTSRASAKDMERRRLLGRPQAWVSASPLPCTRSSWLWTSMVSSINNLIRWLRGLNEMPHTTSPIAGTQER